MKNLDSLVAELTSGSDIRAQKAVRDLPSFGSDAITTLTKLLTNPQPDIRWWALRALAEFSDPGVAHHLVLGLQDMDPGVRQCAALALREHPDPRNLISLLQTLEDQDHLVARLAGDALAALGQVAVPGLLVILDGSFQPARLEAVRALAVIGDPSSIPRLLAILKDGDTPLTEYWADIALERMGVGMVFFNP